MESYTYLLLLALILLSTKAFGLVTEHVHMPQVVGALLAGIILGPSGFGVLESSDFLVKTAEIGVIMLMFTAGIDTDMDELKETGPQACTCNDSCMEFFFSPTERSDYFNIELNPNCAVWIGIGTGVNISDLIRLQISKFTEKFKTNVEFTEKGWVLTYKVPFAFIKRFFNDFEAKEGKTIRGNLYKCGDRTVKPHWMTWNYVDIDHPAFHCPEFFGELTFGGE